ncbi:MAG: hypothetical protein AB7S68_16715 [Polyangiaceae bacterium]
MKLCKTLWVAFALSWAVPVAAQTPDKPAEATATKAADAKAADAKDADAKDAAAADAKDGAAKDGAAASGDAKAAEKPATEAAGAKDETSDAPVDGATYQVRLRDLESKVDELKEQIRRSHTRLSLLSETILGGGVGGARAEIRFTNEMSSAFRLVRALFVLDGAVQYNKKDESGALAEQREIPIFSGSITPGDHTLQTLVQLRGHGYGVFSYLRGYRFEVKSSHSFTVTEGKTIRLDVVAWEKGGVTTPLEQRPAVRYVEKLASGTSAAAPAASDSPKSSGVSGGISIGTGGK